MGGTIFCERIAEEVKKKLIILVLEVCFAKMVLEGVTSSNSPLAQVRVCVINILVVYFLLG